MMNKPQNILVLLIVITFLSCNRNPKKEVETDKKDSVASYTQDSIVSFVDNAPIDSNLFKINNIEIFPLNVYEEEGNIPLSDYFGYSNHPDSLVIPKKYLGDKKLKVGDNSYLKLSGAYRTRYLAYNNKKETDSIFVFSCKLDTIFSYQIKDVSIVAFLSGYIK